MDAWAEKLIAVTLFMNGRKVDINGRQLGRDFLADGNRLIQIQKMVPCRGLGPRLRLDSCDSISSSSGATAAAFILMTVWCCSSSKVAVAVGGAIVTGCTSRITKKR